MQILGETPKLLSLLVSFLIGGNHSTGFPLELSCAQWGKRAVRFNTQRRMTNKTSHPPGGVSTVDTLERSTIHAWTFLQTVSAFCKKLCACTCVPGNFSSSIQKKFCSHRLEYRFSGEPHKARAEGRDRRNRLYLRRARPAIRRTPAADTIG